MSRNEKLLQRLLSIPSDFTWHELLRIFSFYGYKEIKNGKTGGSRRKFSNAKMNMISLHKPHPSNIVKEYALREVIQYLKVNEHLRDE